MTRSSGPRCGWMGMATLRNSLILRRKLLKKLSLLGGEASLLNEIFPLCKAIVNEYAIKLNLERPAYNTISEEGVLPSRTSSLVFNGSTYVGEEARTKKEAEQLAAHAFILSNLSNSGSGTMLFEMIKAKYNATKRNDLQLQMSAVSLQSELRLLENEKTANKKPRLGSLSPA